MQKVSGPPTIGDQSTTGEKEAKLYLGLPSWPLGMGQPIVAIDGQESQQKATDIPGQWS